jgi:hypothetical protein
MAKLVSWIHGANNGTVALVTEAHYEILKNCSTPDEAYEKGVRWFVFISMERAMRSQELAGIVTGTFKEIEHAPAFHAIDKSIYVPLSNGPMHWDHELKFVFPYSAFLRRIAKELAA